LTETLSQRQNHLATSTAGRIAMNSAFAELQQTQISKCPDMAAFLRYANSSARPHMDTTRVHPDLERKKQNQRSKAVPIASYVAHGIAAQILTQRQLASL